MSSSAHHRDLENLTALFSDTFSPYHIEHIYSIVCRSDFERSKKLLQIAKGDRQDEASYGEESLTPSERHRIESGSHLNDSWRRRNDYPIRAAKSFKRAFIESIPSHILKLLKRQVLGNRSHAFYEQPYEVVTARVIAAAEELSDEFWSLVERSLHDTDGRYSKYNNPKRYMVHYIDEDMLEVMKRAIVEEGGEQVDERLRLASSLPFHRIVTLLIHKFRFDRFPPLSLWRIGADSAAMREEERAVLSQACATSHISLFHRQKMLPMDLFLSILSFLRKDYQLLCSVGLVCEEFFIGFLMSWKSIRISRKNLWRISLLALKSASCVEFARPAQFVARFYQSNDWEYFLQNVNLPNISRLDLTALGDRTPNACVGVLSFIADLENRPIFSGCSHLHLPQMVDIRESRSKEAFRFCWKNLDLLTPLFPRLHTVVNLTAPMSQLLVNCHSIRFAQFYDFEKLGGGQDQDRDVLEANKGLFEIPWLCRVEECHFSIHWQSRDAPEDPVLSPDRTAPRLFLREGVDTFLLRMSLLEKLELRSLKSISRSEHRAFDHSYGTVAAEFSGRDAMFAIPRSVRHLLLQSETAADAIRIKWEEDQSVDDFDVSYSQPPAVMFPLCEFLSRTRNSLTLSCGFASDLFRDQSLFQGFFDGFASFSGKKRIHLTFWGTRCPENFTQIRESFCPAIFRFLYDGHTESEEFIVIDCLAPILVEYPSRTQVEMRTLLGAIPFHLFDRSRTVLRLYSPASKGPGDVDVLGIRDLVSEIRSCRMDHFLDDDWK